MYIPHRIFCLKSARHLLCLRQTHGAANNAKRKRFVHRSDQFGLMGYDALQTEKLKTYNNLDRNAVSNRIIDDKWDHYNFGERIPVIDKPKSMSKAQERKEKLLQDYQRAHNVNLKEAKVVIQCSRPEFNHYEGMRYPALESIPLVSQYWSKNKYTDEWFIIRRTKPIHASREDSFDRTWQEFIHLIHPQIFQNITRLGFKTPTKIQYDTLRQFSHLDHIFLAAETGSGKTLAYGAPVLSSLLHRKEKVPNAKVLVLTTTTRLKEQTAIKLKDLAENTPLKVLASKKGEKLNPDNFDVLVATPGIAYKVLKDLVDSISIPYLVMDESDMILDDSFVMEIRDVLSIIPIKDTEEEGVKSKDGAHLIFASATCPEGLCDLVDELVNRRNILYITSKNLHKVLANIEQKFIRVRERDKNQKLSEILLEDRKKATNKTLVFCKDNRTADFLSKELNNQYGLENLLMASTRNASESIGENVQVMISTDLASRGLDIPNLTHVVNYDFPRHLVDYVHRIGRVGRCSSGTTKHYVTSFVRLEHEVKHVNAIELAVRMNRPIQGIETNVAGLIKERKMMNE